MPISSPPTSRLAFALLGPIRAQLVAGTLKALLLAGGMLGFVASLPHLEATADALPFGRLGALCWPPYWAARLVEQPIAAGVFWLPLAGAAAVLLAAATLVNRLRPTRVQGRPSHRGILARLDRLVGVPDSSRDEDRCARVDLGRD